MSKSIQHLSNININDEYGTPDNRIKEAFKKYNIFPTLDVCTSDELRKYHQVFSKFYTREDDALTKEWNEDFFMNPPYSRVYDFVKYAFEQHRKHNVTGLILTYSKTDTKWWHEFVENIAEVHFIKGRITFWQPDGFRCKYPAPYPSCWIILRKTNKICQSCEQNPLFENQIVCDNCHEKQIPGLIE